MIDRGQERRDEIEAWWFLIARILAFFLGMVILSYAVFFSQGGTAEKFAWGAVGVGLMGPVAINGVAQAVAILRGHGGRQ